MGVEHAEPIEILQRLIRFDTVNPPGNEDEAIEYLKGLLEPAGWSCKVLAELPETPGDQG